MLEPIDMAWELVRKVAGTTMFDKEFNEGVSLPFPIAKKAAIACLEIFRQRYRDNGSKYMLPAIYTDYWDKVHQELIKLEL